MLKNYLNLIVGKQNILRKKKNKHILTKKNVRLLYKELRKLQA